MQKYANNFQDDNGNALVGASITVYTDSAHTVKATIYSDNGVTTVANPLTTDSNGEFSFYAADGRYYIKAAKATISTQFFDDVLLFDPNASTGSAYVSFTPSGTGALTRTVQAKERAIVSFDDFGSPSNTGAQNDTAWTNLIAALSAGGATILFENPSIYDFATGLSWSDRPIILQGKGGQLQAGVATRLRFPAGVVGINPQNGASGLGANSGLRDIWILGQDSGSGSNPGVKIQCPRFTAINTVVSKFGSHGFHVNSGTTTSTNSNNYVLLNCSAYSNFGDGFHGDGSNCIGVTIEFSSNSNSGWGLYDDGAGIKHIGPEIESNTSGGHRVGINGLQCWTWAGRKESDANPGIQIDAGAGYNKLEYLNMVDSVTDNGAVKSEIVVNAGSAVLHRRLSIGNSTANIVLSDLQALFDLGANLVIKNTGQTAIWTASVNASKQLNFNSAQSEPFLLNGNAIQLPNVVTIAAGTYTVTSSDTYLIANNAGTVTLTIAAASSYPGRFIFVKTIQNQTVVSASSNVIPQAGGGAGTAILAGTAGKWAILVSDASNWQIMASN